MQRRKKDEELDIQAVITRCIADRLPSQGPERFERFQEIANSGGWAFQAVVSFACINVADTMIFDTIEDTGSSQVDQLYQQLQRASPAGAGLYHGQQVIARELLWRFLLIKSTSRAPAFQSELLLIEISSNPRNSCNSAVSPKALASLQWCCPKRH